MQIGCGRQGTCTWPPREFLTVPPTGGEARSGRDSCKQICVPLSPYQRPHTRCHRASLPCHQGPSDPRMGGARVLGATRSGGDESPPADPRAPTHVYKAMFSISMCPHLHHHHTRNHHAQQPHTPVPRPRRPPLRLTLLPRPHSPCLSLLSTPEPSKVPGPRASRCSPPLHSPSPDYPRAHI